MPKREASKSPAPKGNKPQGGAKPTNKPSMPKPPKMGGKIMAPKINHGPITKAKSVSQDFFPRSQSAAADKSQGFLFNAAPINKNEAKEEAKERFAS